MVLLSFLADILTSATRTVVLTILPQCGRLSTGMLLNNGIINKYMEQQEKISMEDIDKIEKIFNVEYSDTVKYAVRYGYNYRIEAEQKHNSYSHACLPDTSAILLWLGQKVIDGVIWDLFKVAAKKLYEKFVKSNSYLSEKLSKFLSDEQDLKRFYTYVKEFNEQNMTVTEEQFKYIREEIIADFFGKECGKIYEQEHRLPTIQEYMRINREALVHADNLMVLQN